MQTSSLSWKPWGSCPSSDFVGLVSGGTLHLGSVGKEMKLVVLTDATDEIQVITIPGASDVEYVTSKGVTISTNRSSLSLLGFNEAQSPKGYKVSRDGDMLVAVEYFHDRIMSYSLFKASRYRGSPTP